MNIKPGRAFSAEEFKRPASEFAVTYMWFWNAPVTRDKVDEELAKYRRAGIESLYIVPLPKDFRPERIRTFLDPEYLSGEFFELVKYTIARALELGITPWLYDEGGWPSGGACGNTLRENPNAVLKLIARREITLECDERYKPCDNFVAIFDGKRRLSDDYIASRTARLTEYYVQHTAEDGNRVDYTSAAVTDTFIKNTYDAYKECLGADFGTTVPLIFTDEPGLLRNSVAEGEFEIFEGEYGYDLRDYAYVLIDAGELAETDEEIRARIDHYTLLGRLFRENTCKRLYDWCEKNGIYYGGHLDIDNRPFGGMVKGYFSHIDFLRKFHVPGIDVIWEQIRYPYGGRAPVDDETLGFGFFPRLASSAARQEGRCVSVSESLGIYGDALTPDEIRFVINYQTVRGINAVNFAPISFGKARLAALTTRPNFRPEKPGFYNMEHIHEYFARTSYLARLGYAEGDTALYIPCRDYCADVAACDDATASFKAAGTALEAKNIAFDIVDDYVIRDATDTGDGLKIGDAIYRHVVVPECRYMPDDVKEKIAPYLGEGAPTYLAKSKNLRFMTRKLDTGRLYFVFNEGIDTANEGFSFVGGDNTYRLMPSCGEVHLYGGEEVFLPCGEMGVFYVTNEVLKTVTDEVEYTATASDFSAVSHKRFCIDHRGISEIFADGAPSDALPFSGEVSYVGKYELPEEPRQGERYRIALEDFSVSAEVRIGRARLTLGMTPMSGIVDGGKLCKSGEITVTVANTGADEISAKRSVIYSFPKAEVGPYQEKIEKFEKRAPVLKFGRVYIEKLR